MQHAHAVTIQKQARGFLTRMQFWRWGAEKDRSATKLQSYARMLQQHRLYQKTKNAAKKVQAYIRGFCVRQAMIKAGNLHDRLSRKIDSPVNDSDNEFSIVLDDGTCITKNIYKTLSKRQGAAIAIQKRFRGNLTRKALWKQITYTKDYGYDGFFPGTIISKNKSGTFNIEFDHGQICNSIDPYEIKEETSKRFEKGDRCESTENAWRSYFGGTVTKVYRNGNDEIVYDIIYDDGTNGMFIPQHYIRKAPKFARKFKIGELVEVTEQHWEDRQLGFILDINAATSSLRTYRIKLKRTNREKRILENVQEYCIRPYAELENGCRVEATRPAWNHAYFEGTVVEVNANFGTFCVIFDDGEYFDNTELSDVRRRHFHSYSVGNHVLVKFDNHHQPFMGTVKSVTRNKSFYHIEFYSEETNETVLEKIHASSILWRVREDWKKYDRVMAKIPGTSFINQVIMHRVGSDLRAEKLYAILLIQKYVMKWKRKRKAVEKLKKMSVADLISHSGNTTQQKNGFHKTMTSYIEERVQKHVQNNLSLLSPFSNHHASAYFEEDHFDEKDFNLKFDDALCQNIDLLIKTKVSQHIEEQRLHRPSSASNISNYNKQIDVNNTPNLLRMDDYEKANSDNADSLSTVTTSTLRNNINTTSTFSMGDSVLAIQHDWDSRCYNGHIVGVNTDGTYAIEFLDGDLAPQVPLRHIKKYDNYRTGQRSMHYRDDSNNFTGIENKSSAQYISENARQYFPGDAILATHSDWDNKYFPGRVQRSNNDGTYIVHFYDGDISNNIHPDHIQDIPFKKNDRVFAKHDHWVDMHLGTIVLLNNDGTFNISFDDGDSGDIKLKNVAPINNKIKRGMVRMKQ
jgi:hypothetical protein